MTDSEPIPYIIAIVALTLACVAVGLVSHNNGRHAMKVEAVEHGAAEWVHEDHDGQADGFEWIVEKEQH